MVSILRFLTPKNSVAYINADDTLRQGLEKMRHHRYSDVPVLDGDGRYVGTLSESDILYRMLDTGECHMRELENTRVVDIIQKTPDFYVNSRAPIRQLLEYVKEHKFVPVVDDRVIFIGIVTRKDVINYFINQYLDTEIKTEKREE